MEEETNVKDAKEMFNDYKSLSKDKQIFIQGLIKGLAIKGKQAKVSN